MHIIDFSNKDVLITGGGAGIGRAIVEAFAKAAATLHIIEINSDYAADLQNKFPDAHVITGDICDKKTPALLAKAIASKAGKLDVLINNVGHFVRSLPFDQLNNEQAEVIIDINLGQILRTVKHMLPLLRLAGRGSSIINISSIEAYRGIPYCSVYAAAKAGITGFTKSLALELAPEGIRINDIAPETTDTPQVPLDYMIPPENRTHMDKWIPLGRFGQPTDCAGAALYLASPLAEWVTGTALHVDGGALAASGWVRTPDGQWTLTPLISGNALKTTIS